MKLFDQSWQNVASQLEVVLQERLGRRIPDLQVAVQQRGLVLRGHSATWYVKQLAQHTAAQLTGLPVLANEIEVC